MSLRVIYQDILTMEVDALVNSTNPLLVGMSGVDRLVHQAGGEALEAECEALAGTCVLGKSLHTNAYNLPCRYIIHTMCPDWDGGENGEEAILRSCYWTALAEAETLNCMSVAFPLISAGTMGYPVSQALEVAVTAITEYLALYGDLEVYLVLYGEVVRRIARSMMGELDNYIDVTLQKLPPESDDATLEQLLENTGEGFVQTLTGFIDAKGLKDSQVYKRAGVSKGTFNKIINGGTKKPSIETVSALAIALELTYDEAVTLLASAGMTFSYSSKFDIIVSYFLKHGIYDIWRLDEQLLKYGCKSLLGIE